MQREELARIAEDNLAAWNRHDPDAIASFFAEDAVLYDEALPEPVRGPGGVREVAAGYLRAFPDLKVESIERVIDGNTMVDCWRVSGTHEGELMGVAPTHRRIMSEGCTITHFGEDGKVHDDHMFWNPAKLMEQLGATAGAGAAMS